MTAPDYSINAVNVTVELATEAGPVEVAWQRPEFAHVSGTVEYKGRRWHVDMGCAGPEWAEETPRDFKENRSDYEKARVLAPTYRADVAGKIRAALADYVSARPDVLTAVERLRLGRLIETEDKRVKRVRAELATAENNLAGYRASLAELEGA